MGFVRVAAFSAVGGTLGAAGLVIWRLSALPARSDHCAASCLVGNVAAALVIQRSSRGFVCALRLFGFFGSFSWLLVPTPLPSRV